MAKRGFDQAADACDHESRVCATTCQDAFQGASKVSAWRESDGQEVHVSELALRSSSRAFRPLSNSLRCCVFMVMAMPSMSIGDQYAASSISRRPRVR
jgi:hypothetical protein